MSEPKRPKNAQPDGPAIKVVVTLDRRMNVQVQSNTANQQQVFVALMEGAKIVALQMSQQEEQSPIVRPF